MNVMVSVVIPAHNEEQYLEATLSALKQQTHPCFEILVVANGCVDRTAEVAQKLSDRLVVLEERGLSRARNVGAAKARGNLLVFLDADTLLEPQALDRIASEFTADCSSGTVRGRPDRGRLSYRVIYLLKNSFHRFGIHRGSAGVILCWKDHFKLAGGFDEALQLRENSELIKRLGKFGRYRYISSTTAVTSMRRYEKRGGRAMWLWFKLWVISFFTDLRNRHYEAVR
jgi:glycosyltransferase involved in cell wall biosynthesis